MKRRKFAKLLDWLLGLIVLGLLLARIPNILDQWALEGKQIAPQELYSQQGAKVLVPSLGKRQIAIFWATWCKPCELELSRFNAAISSGELSADAVVAVNLGEEPELAFATGKSREYRMQIVADPEAKLGSLLNVAGTPTVVHLDEHAVVYYASTGLGLIPVWRAKRFLRGKG